jgi:3-hydroxyacyl-[acyl-carrier-protein] dehydratase
MDTSEISKILKREYPLLLIDRVTLIEPKKACHAYKNITYNEWFFPVHFPDNPIMPGTLQVEAFTQAVSLPLLVADDLNDAREIPILLAGIDKIRLYRPVVPGDKFEIYANIDRIAMGIVTASASGYVNNEIVSECKITYKLL